MNGLTRYILVQAAGPFAFATLVLTGVIWLTQALRMLDLLIVQGQSTATYFMLTGLALPGVLNIVLPIALFCAVLYALNKLITDSELVVMFSAGASRWALARPVFMLAGFTSLIVIALNLYVTPAGLRELKSRLFEIRADFASAMIREGAFTNPVTGLTVYVRERSPDGRIQGILVHDNRNTAQPITYMAETGSLVRSDAGPRLIMYNGNIQRASKKGDTSGSGDSDSLTLLYFDKYSYDLSQYASGSTDAYFEARERFMDELFFPDADDFYGQRFSAKLRAEGHDRLVAPLYPVMFAFIAIVALLPAPFSRRGYALRIILAVSAAILIRVMAFGLLNLTVKTPMLSVMMYLLPLGAIGICFMIMADPAERPWTEVTPRQRDWLDGRQLEG